MSQSPKVYVFVSNVNKSFLIKGNLAQHREKLNLRGVPSHWRKVGHHSPHEVVSLIAQRAQSDVSIVDNYNAPFGIKRISTYTSKFHKLCLPHRIQQLISLSMLACIKVLPWLDKNNFRWCKALQHQIPCLAPMVLVSVKVIISLK